MNFTPNFESTDKELSYEPIKNYMVHVKDLVTFSPDQIISEVIDTILDKKISGAPVLDKAGNLVGIISEKDCLRLIIDRAYYNMPNQKSTVADYMTKAVRTVSPNMDIVTAANEFLIAPVRRFPIVEGGKLLGQISRRDILKAARKIKATTW